MTATFKERLNEANRFIDIPQKELADRIGISKALMNQYFKGQSSPKDLDKVVKLAIIFDVNPAWLAGYDIPRDLTQKDIEFLNRYKKLNESAKEIIDATLRAFLPAEEIEIKKLA